MPRLPLIPSLLVGLAILMMCGLGVWQIGRAAEKADYLARFTEAAKAPAMAWPQTTNAADAPLYRPSGFHCLEVTNWRASSGRNAQGASGFRHIASCKLGAEGPGAQLVAGWSQRPDPPDWQGGEVSGVIAPDRDHIIKLVADPPIAGLQANMRPSSSEIPNNHIAYAIQWFLFALIAAAIYILALKRQQKTA